MRFAIYTTVEYIDGVVKGWKFIEMVISGTLRSFKDMVPRHEALKRRCQSVPFRGSKVAKSAVWQRCFPNTVKSQT